MLLLCFSATTSPLLGVLSENFMNEMLVSQTAKGCPWFISSN